MVSDLPAIKVLFGKLYKAHVWAASHCQEEYPEQWVGKLLPYLDGVYADLEKLGVTTSFSAGLFAFGIEYTQALRCWEDVKGG